jgi:hypothetical protein
MISIEQVRAKVASQKTLLPALYGGIDFGSDPERFTHDASAAVVQDRAPNGVAVTDEDLERVRAYTMLGDVVVDAYAALMPQYGFRKLIAMLQEACEHGVEHVADAPPELVTFIRAMEQTPDWLDMDMVREGARLERNATAHLAPFAVRGAFIATFLNKYSALPMALTGTLSSETAAKRVNETATFFATQHCLAHWNVSAKASRRRPWCASCIPWCASTPSAPAAGMQASMACRSRRWIRCQRALSRCF